MKPYKLTVLLFFIFSIFFSCKKKDTNQAPQHLVVSDTSYSLEEKFNEAKQIVYSLPSPQEVSMILLDNMNVGFEPDLMNDYSNVDKYTSDLSRALNLGIYSADISFATIFEQNQVAINYMNAAKKLAENLGILNYFTEENIEQLENNITNRDEVMKIITEAYMRSDAKLQEDKRDDIGALILIGGWVEGMYIAVNLTHCNVKDNPRLISSIMEQQLSLALLSDFLHYYESNKLLSEIAQDIYNLDKLFQSVKTDIDDNGNIIVSQQDFEKICKAIKNIRTKYVNMI